MKLRRIAAMLLAALVLLSLPGVMQAAQAADVSAAQPSAGSYQVVVTADLLNIRKNPSNTAAIVGLLRKGDVVTITATQKDSRGVCWGKMSKGWINLNFTDKKNSDDSFTGIVQVPSLNVRSSPNNSSKVVKVLKKGTKVTITETQSDSRGIVWGKVKGAGGWINTDFLKTSTEVNYRVKVTGSKANIRQYASLGAKLVGSLSKGTIVRVTAKQKDSRGVTWVKLASGKGWISMANAKKISSFESYKVRITAASLKIHKSPSLTSTVTGYLQKNDVVTIVAEQSTSDGRTWGQLSNGKGWISLKYTKKV